MVVRGLGKKTKVFFGSYMECIIWLQEHTVMIGNDHVKATPEKVPDEAYKSSTFGYYTYDIDKL